LFRGVCCTSAPPRPPYPTDIFLRRASAFYEIDWPRSTRELPRSATPRPPLFAHSLRKTFSSYTLTSLLPSRRSPPRNPVPICGLHRFKNKVMNSRIGWHWFRCSGFCLIAGWLCGRLPTLRRSPDNSASTLAEFRTCPVIDPPPALFRESPPSASKNPPPPKARNPVNFMGRFVTNLSIRKLIWTLNFTSGQYSG